MEIVERATGQDQPTRERVVRSVLVNGPSTAAALAERLELTPAAVRRHLDQLIDEGTLEAREPRVTAVRGRGRPAKVFALTEAGRDRLRPGLRRPRRPGDPLPRRDRWRGGRPPVRRPPGRQDRAALPRRRRGASRPGPGRGAGAGLHRRGVRRRGARRAASGEQLCQQHCPVSHVAHEFPELCEAETAAISRMLGRHVQRLATIAHGDGVCTTCIPRHPDSSTTEKERVTR